MDDLFKSKPVETSEGEPAEPSEGEPAPPSKGETQKGKEGTSQWYKSQLDKFQSDYNKKLSEKEEAWEKEKKELLVNLRQLQGQFEEIKKPPEEKLEYPQRPQQPADFDYTDAVTDPNSGSAKYMRALLDYESKRDEYYAKKDRMRDAELSNVKEKLASAEKLKVMAEQRELQKAQTIGAFQEEGLSPEDSSQLWKILEGAWNSPIKEGAKVFANMYKAEIAKPSDKTKEFDRRKDKREQFIPPGTDGAGSIPPDDETKQFMDEVSGRKNTGIFRTK